MGRHDGFYSGSTAAYPAGAEQRVAQFAELVSTAISNIESRRPSWRNAAEQSALRRVADLVARQAPSQQVFGVVTEELCKLLDVNMMRTVRFEPDGTATVLAAHGVSQDLIPAGTTNIRLPQGTVIDQVFRTGCPARVDDYAQVGGPIGELRGQRGRAAPREGRSSSTAGCGAPWRWDPRRSCHPGQNTV